MVGKLYSACLTHLLSLLHMSFDQRCHKVSVLFCSVIVTFGLNSIVIIMQFNSDMIYKHMVQDLTVR